MKTIATSILALVLFALPAMAGDFSGSFGREHLPACNSVNGNFVGAFDSCPPLGNGPDPVSRTRGPDMVVVPPHECPPKTETPA